ASSFYGMGGAGNPGGRPSINYARALRILLTMQAGDSIKVEKVDMTGQVDGLQLQPKAGKVDTLRPDTVGIKPSRPRVLR
ncbi:MAG TPA: hypothetical protein VFW45_14380, partial [Candidatus Polarisedimenticolia bacterium]|nr:hypothetical protein [Candidatus Polarisedimenticolia bacterium]